MVDPDDFVDEGAGYDAGVDFGFDAPSAKTTVTDASLLSPADAKPIADEPPACPSTVDVSSKQAGVWVLGQMNETSRLADLLPLLPERRRATTSDGARPAGKKRSAAEGERPGDLLERSVPVSDLLEQLGWELDGEGADGGSRWIRPAHSEPYDGSHDATVYLDTDGVERVTVFSERQRSAWGLTDAHSCSTFDLLIKVFCGEDAHLAANVARLVLASDAPAERLGELLTQDDGDAPPDAVARLRAAVDAANPAAAVSQGASVARWRGVRVSTAFVDWDGECVKASDAPDATVLVDAGLRIVRRIVVEDDLNPGTPTDRLYDIAVRLGGAVHVVRDVYSSELSQPRLWLDRIPGAISDGIVIAPLHKVDTEIEVALRAQMKLENPPVHLALRRIGWASADGRVGYLTVDGAVTANGLDEHLRALVSGPPSAIHLTEPDPSRIEADVRTVLSIPALLSESGKNVLTCLFATLAWAHSGVTPPAAGLVILGEKGSGKTALVRRILSGLSPDPDSLLTNLDSSAGVIGEVGAGAHNTVSWVDDARDKPSERMSEEQAASVDSLLRRTYGGGVAGRARLRPDGHGRYIRQDPDRSSPMALMTAERLPSLTTISSLERCLTVELLPMLPGEEPFDDRLKQLLADWSIRRCWGAFIRHLAARIDACAPGDPDAALATWRAQLEGLRTEVVSDFLVSGQLTARQAEVIAGFVIGWRLWTEFCTEAANLDTSEALSLASDGQLRLSEAARRHAYGTMDPGEVGPLSVLNRLRQATLGERGWIDGQGFPVPADVSRVELLGRVVTERSTGRPYVALLHDVAAKAIGMRSGLELVGSLGQLILRDGSGRRTRLTKVRGTVIRAVWIPLDMWQETDDLDDEPQRSQTLAIDEEDF